MQGDESEKGEASLPSATPEKHAILVAGMHRSGTSALTRVISLLGYDLPKHLLPPSDDDNRLGFWESKEVMALNNDILTQLGSGWNDWTSLEVRLRNDAAFFDAQVARAAGAIEAEFNDTSRIILKDPRICRLAPVWVTALAQMDFQVGFVMPIRNPLEVGLSLEKRNKIHIDYSLLAWLRHVLDAEVYSRDMPRAVSLYEGLLEDWRGSVSNVAQGLQIEWPRKLDKAAPEINRFLSRRERHNAISDHELNADATVSNWVKDIYAVMLEWSAEGPKSEGLATLDRVRDEMENVTPIFHRVIDDSMALVSTLRDKNDSTARRIEEVRRDLAITQAQVSQERQIRQEFSEKLVASAKEGANLQSTVERLKFEKVALQETIDTQKAADRQLREQLALHENESLDLRSRIKDHEHAGRMLEKEVAAQRDANSQLQDANSNLRDIAESRANAIRDLRQLVQTHYSALQDLREEVGRVLEECAQLRAQLEEASSRTKLAEIERARVETALSDTKQSWQTAQATLDELTKKYDQIRTQHSSLTIELSKETQDNARLKDKIGQNLEVLKQKQSQLVDSQAALTRSQLWIQASFKNSVELAGKTMLPEPFPTFRRMLEIRASGLFDANWYVSHYQDVAADMRARSNPIWHFARHGWREGRAPNADIAKALASRGQPQNAQAPIPPSAQEAKPVTAQPSPPTADAARVPEPKPLGNAIAKTVSSLSPKKVAEARSREKVRQVIEQEFDEQYYLYKYPDIAKAKRITPLSHYIEHGGKEGRNPNARFHGRFYLDQNPDVKESGVHPFYHYLTVGRDEGRPASPMAAGAPVFDKMCQILGREPREVEDDLTARHKDLRDRLENGVLGDMVAKAAELEPLIAHSRREIVSAKIPPFHSPPVMNEVVATHRLHEEAEFCRAKAVVVIPHCRMSGATRIGGYLAKALADIYGSDQVVIVRTDLDIMQFPEWFPENARHVNFAAAAEGLDRAQRQKMLVEFLRALDPVGVYNVNSSLFWSILQPFGKALSASTNLYCYFFCNDKNIYGHWEGYPATQFYRHFDVLSGVMTDSHFLADELKNRFMVPPSLSHKVTVLETPVSVSPDPVLVPPKNERPRIFWSGRFDRQKRIDIAFEVARKMPDVDFFFWGDSVVDDLIKKLDQPSNVNLRGSYQKFEDLPLAECDAWLYTAEWDGVPNMLIEVATAGVPLVGSLAGGTGEVLQVGYAVGVADIEDVDAYVAGLREILEEPERARSKAAELRERILTRRTHKAYQESVSALIESTHSDGHAE